MARSAISELDAQKELVYLNARKELEVRALLCFLD
jgi:hypothetical protein